MFEITFVDFDICHRMASSRKLYSVILAYFLKVKDSNRDFTTATNAHSVVTSANTALLVVAKCDEASWWRYFQQNISPADALSVCARSKGCFTCCFSIRLSPPLHYIALKEMQTLSAPSKGQGRSQFDCEKTNRKLSHAAFRRMSPSTLLFFV